MQKSKPIYAAALFNRYFEWHMSNTMKNPPSLFILFIAFILLSSSISAQQITGNWKGRINNQRVELKIIQNGDSLTGTSYYSSLTGGTKRYSIKGYFDPVDNSVVWWDDALITANGFKENSDNLLAVADFNCPGGGRMYLNGKSAKKNEPNNKTGKVDLTKTDQSAHKDEWDFVLDNYNLGANDPQIIDSIEAIASNRRTPVAPANPLPQPIRKIVTPTSKQPDVARNEPPVTRAVKVAPAPQPKQPTQAPLPPPVKTVQKAAPPKPETIDEMFVSRKKMVTKEIVLEGDSIKLMFYDNAEVDGDSISLFLNNKIIFTHVRLAATPYTISLSVNDLADVNDLVMVAENLGAIPPNTAFMIAMVGATRYEAYMESTEQTSSVIRFIKKKKE
ncbi:MAG: hypothetical protein LH478_08245 [Chitinophagaceae bacterium]|nr:hypothetical protein [Chitinophagaceae bacterium]